MNEDILNVSGLKVKIGKKTILDGIEIGFSKGECVLIAGANGAGKSTFLKCLAGVILPDKGEVRYRDGIGTEKIGFISDQLSLFENFTVKLGIKFLEAVIDLMDRCGTTVFMVNHTFSEIERIPERVLVMADGRFIADEKSEVLAAKLKKVISNKEIPGEVPLIFSKEAAGTHDHYVYPFSLELKERFPFEYIDVDLNEIIKAFIGGQYAEKRME